MVNKLQMSTDTETFTQLSTKLDPVIFGRDFSRKNCWRGNGNAMRAIEASYRAIRLDYTSLVLAFLFEPTFCPSTPSDPAAAAASFSLRFFAENSGMTKIAGLDGRLVVLDGVEMEGVDGADAGVGVDILMTDLMG